MKKIFFYAIILYFLTLFCGDSFSAPSSTLSISPSAVDATTITASDENSRNSAVVTWANAHDHTDIATVGNTLSVGDAAAGNKQINANNADANKPFLRYDDTNNRWLASNDGTATDAVLMVTGATVSSFTIPATQLTGVLPINRGGTNSNSANGALEGAKWRTKAWICLTGTGTISIDDQFNVSSIVDAGTGQYTVNWDRDFTSNNYAVVEDSTENQANVGFGSKVAASVLISVRNDAGTYSDAGTMCAIAVGSN